MKNLFFNVFTIFSIVVFVASCRPAIADNLNDCRKNCNSGDLNNDTACLDRCNCFHTHDQKIKKCNSEYDEAVKSN